MTRGRAEREGREGHEGLWAPVDKERPRLCTFPKGVHRPPLVPPKARSQVKAVTCFGGIRQKCFSIKSCPFNPTSFLEEARSGASTGALVTVGTFPRSGPEVRPLHSLQADIHATS